MRDKKGGGKGRKSRASESWTERRRRKRERSGVGREKVQQAELGAPGWRDGPRPAAPPASARPGHLAVAVVPQALREVQAGGVPRPPRGRTTHPRPSRARGRGAD